jgi:neutral amino acid transport system ATP-binding protein
VSDKTPVADLVFDVTDIAPGVKKKDPIVVADKVSRQFGGLTAVDVEHLEIPRGSITALIGPNRAVRTSSPPSSARCGGVARKR